MSRMLAVLMLMGVAVMSLVPVSGQVVTNASGSFMNAGGKEIPEEQFGSVAGDESILDSEGIGGLKMGLPETEVLKSLAGKPQKGKETFQGADGMHVQDWSFADLGVELMMSSEKKGGAKSVQSITIKSPCKLQTKLGIGIGSPEEAVRKAYAKWEDQEASKKGELFVAGSVYGGVVFTFSKGKVEQIFLGASAE